jgi:membrane associated rhomboid family serine protease
MASGPDLFVVCKNCGSQVSPYITECPYCGQRIRKRAPKIERQPRPEEPKRRRVPAALGPLRSGEIPGIRADETRRPWATIVLVGLAAFWWLALVPLREESVRFVVSPNEDWWQVLTAPFVHFNGWAQFAALAAVGLFGWLLERRHGPVTVVLLWLLTASGGIAVAKAAAELEQPFAISATGAGLGMLCAWAVPVLLARRRRPEEDDDADLLGVAVIFALLVLLPVATPDGDGIDAIATYAGGAAGALAGLVLARLSPR